MPVKSTADLLVENDAVVTSQVLPESISPSSLGGTLNRNIIESMYNKTTDALIPAPRSLTKAALAAEIGASSLIDGQQITITDRADGFPLIVWCKGTNKIHPCATWFFNNTTPLHVIIDYVGGYNGETNPFIAVFNDTRNLLLNNSIIIKDGTQLVNAKLISDSNGKGRWGLQGYLKSGVLNPAMILGSSPSITYQFAGINKTIVCKSTGKVIINISGQVSSSSNTGNTTIRVLSATYGGSTPAHNSASTNHSLVIDSYAFTPLVIGEKYSFSINTGFTAAINSEYWIDLDCLNNTSGNIQFFNLTVTAIEI